MAPRDLQESLRRRQRTAPWSHLRQQQSLYYANTIEPMGHQELGQKEMLYIIDGLYGSSTPNADPTKWTMAPFNNAWPSSVFVSQDPVAIDSVEYDF